MKCYICYNIHNVEYYEILDKQIPLCHDCVPGLPWLSEDDKKMHYQLFFNHTTRGRLIQLRIAWDNFIDELVSRISKTINERGEL